MSTSLFFSRLALPPGAAEADARLDSPSFQRNGPPIVDALRPWLAEATGDVLEIGSGSGQHAALLAHSFPSLTFQPSDPSAAHRASIEAWRAHLRLETMRPVIDLDVRDQEWPLRLEGDEARLRAVFCANVIHIAPWSVAEGLFRGAARRLAPDGLLALYGPFRWHGRHHSEGNQAFDQSLRARDPAWGVRDVDDLDQLATAHGMARVDVAAMPADNHILFYSRAPG